MLPQILSNVDKQKLLEQNPHVKTNDEIEHALSELYDIANPQNKDPKTPEEVKEYGQKITNSDADNWGNWVYYPWLGQVVHMPPKEELRALRTSRNRNLITADEQQKLYQATILIIGMSVGSNVVEALVSQGVGGTLVLIDMDIIEPSNLNRIRAPYHHVGLHKVDAISRKVWEIDPYIKIVAYTDGLTESNMDQVFTDNKIDIVIDEMDELRMKVLLREKAKTEKLPVIMAADDGDDALIDIERYDTKDLELFNGLIPADIIKKIKSKSLPRAQTGLLIGKYFVGPEHIPLRMFQSLNEVGKTLPSWPQLGGAASLSGVTLTYIARRIILGHSLRDGRILISLDQKLNLDTEDQSHNQELKNYQNQLKNIEL